MRITSFVNQALTVGALCIAGMLEAQAPPPITAPKNAARRAAAATNAHVDAVQNVPAAAGMAARAGSGVDSAKSSAAPRTAARPAPTTPRPTPDTRTAGAAKQNASTPAQAASTSVSERGGRSELTLSRETFSYSTDGRRDPFFSLMSSGELRPMISDLRLVTIVYDPTGRSVAVLRDLSTKEQYRVRVGQTLGRMRVAHIRPKTVTFTLDEFGFSRQEELALTDSTQARTQ
jgi:hypothetical protein